MKQCLGCYKKLEEILASNEYHPYCSKKLFGIPTPPLINFGSEQLEELAKEALSRHLGLTGVQPKISTDLKKHEDDPKHRLMIVGLFGNFILKTPSKHFPEITTVEDATMHMARIFGIKTVRHGLLRLKSQELAYVTRRFDRSEKETKIAVEDFCQLSGLLTESKYKTSMEKAGKIILRYSSHPGLDVVTFFDISLFSFLIGNADMHLKNFSLITNNNGESVLSPAYDLLSTKLLLSQDPEEIALTVNGKKDKIKRKDFMAMGEILKIPTKAMENSFLRLERAIPAMKETITLSFLSDDLKHRYIELIDLRSKILFASKNGRHGKLLA